MMRNLALTITFVVVLACMASTSAQISDDPSSIENTKHNLTRWGPGTVKAIPQIKEELCIFCHTPHISRGTSEDRPFGWNREDSTATYTTYKSTTIYASPGQPTGASKLCLSCHDGTIALGSILSQRNVIPFQGNWEDSSANLGTYLADDHPISFVYDDELAAKNGSLEDPQSLPPNMRLDGDGQLQCTTCHDPHDNSNGMFLVVPDPARTLCVLCHKLGNWAQSSHAISPAVWNGQNNDPWEHVSDDIQHASVEQNTCYNCHATHNAKGALSLLGYDKEEENCLNCHNGNVASTDIKAELTKPFAHRPSYYDDIHLASESYSFFEFERHVECTDCHNPHEADSSTAEAPLLPGPLKGVSGIDRTGQFVSKASFGYEVCFKCHADANTTESIDIVRELRQFNTRLEFLSENPSAHPIIAARHDNQTPSLFPEFGEDAVIACGDCHGSDESTTNDVGILRGPHGSSHEYLLVRRYQTRDNTPESPDAYALCYGCHDRNSILGDESFAEHDSHVRGQNTPCSVCHDPHGISETQGSVQNHQYLINFDINVVSPNALGSLYWEEGSQGPGSSRCSLACHGVDHNNTEDRPIGFDPTNGLSGSPNSWPFSGAFPD